jgi:RNA polymerase sigma-70 factor (ECF subfamily)
MTEPTSTVTSLLVAWSSGNEKALNRLLPLVSAELRRLASGQLRHERPDHSLQPTALVNEAYVRLVQIKRMNWQNRAHFYAMCARLMRRILIDAGRARRFAKRGGDVVRVTLDEGCLPLRAPAPTSSRSMTRFARSKRSTLEKAASWSCGSLQA